MLEQVKYFKLDGSPIYCERYGSGHINSTYLLVDATAREYILQKVNKNVFKDPQALMQNILLVTTHLRSKTDSQREVLTLVKTVEDKDWLVDSEGEYWRLYEFITDSSSINITSDLEVFGESGYAFGVFQKRLSDFPAESLTETIKDFHNTPKRFETFCDAIEKDIVARAKTATKEIEYALTHKEYAKTLVDLQAKGDIPLRVTHNDTKLNNILFDRVTNKALCVVDLDTVMPGLAANDFGDSIRFGASTAVEDEKDLDKVNFSLPLYEAYVKGFLSSCGDSLTECEILHLRDGAKMMTLECGIRFLTDYLSGDTYFHIERDGHNLDRARTQLKLVEEMDKNWDKMQEIILKHYKK